MQATMTLLQHPNLQTSRLSSRSTYSNALPAVPAYSVTRRTAAAPQAFMRSNCGMPFGAGRANQQILEQMLREVSGISSACSPAAAKDFELPLAVDAADEEDAYVFQADIPGVDRANLKVQTKDGKLTISGKRERSSQPDSDRKRRFERLTGKFSRQLRLPEDADCNCIKAKVDNGVLTVRVGKLAKLPGVEDVQVDF